MAREPNERIGAGQWLEKADDFKSLGIEVPRGFVIGTSTGQYYAHYNVHADGHTTVEWYKRGAGGGGEQPDPVETTTAGPTAKTVKDEWDKGGTARPANVTVGVNPASGKPSQKSTYPDGHVEWDDTQVPASAKTDDEWHTEGTPDGQGGFDNTKPIMARTVNGVKQYRQPDDKELRSWQNTQQMGRNPGGKTDAEIAAEAAKADTALPGVQQTTDAQGRTVKRTTYRRPDGTTYTAEDVVQAAPPKPELVNTPSDQMWTVARKPDGTFETVKNPNYVKPSRIMADPADPTRLINITHDDQGRVIAEPVTGQTAIKPADLPVLQTKYGQIAQGLGALAQDLNSRYARGEITEKQKNDAFTAAHQQAQTQVAEINTILDTSKAIWSGELTQRGQSLGETQSRRGFAQNIFDRSVATGLAVGESSGPGHGRAIAAGVGALMRMGQRYAEGMGGFRESPEVALPPALQQARGIGIPGYEESGVRSQESGVPSAGPPSPAAGLPPPPPTGISDTTDAGGVPRVMTPGAATGGMPVPQAGMPGQDPRLAAMQQQLMGGDGFGGSPVAAGGLGVYDPSQDVSGMVGDGADPTWAEAVRRAAGELSQPGYAWQRFTQPTSRFG